MTTHTTIDSPLGELTLVADRGELTGLYFPHHWYRPPTVGPRDDRGFEEVTRQLTEYFAGTRTTFAVPLRADGDQFQRSVWTELARVPYGATVTYGELATALGDAALAREVGAAVGRNPLSVLVACHRVVGKNGKLTGYAGGLKRKRFLLNLESPTAGLW
ncbi:methylated-DNA--[protein]-cysteine S-methyltransferase [Actinophytocola sp.]|jgi:methylated-DNA-[protein]-cysteine S-methyltransferase|uniref:methylated-DNA--[protein]-cysteine S-methyltransferase n=1 Tax=Actinophytocola sp. TaxID=1872138 RepID=UPI002EDA9C5E